MLLKLIISFSLLVLKCNGNLLSFIEPCHVVDNDCILVSAKKALPHLLPGIPELGIPSMDPLVVDDVNGDNGDLKLQFKKMSVFGPGKCEIIKIVRTTQYHAELIVECPITAKGQYELGGKLFVIDVYGSGDFEIKTDKIRIEVSIDMKEDKREDGKEYYKIKKFDYKYLPIEKVYFTFKNLFNGDRAKAEPIEKILDENWLPVVSDVGKNVINEIIIKAVNCVNQLFHNLPKSEFELH